MFEVNQPLEGRVPRGEVKLVMQGSALTAYELEGVPYNGRKTLVWGTTTPCLPRALAPLPAYLNDCEALYELR